MLRRHVGGASRLDGLTVAAYSNGADSSRDEYQGALAVLRRYTGDSGTLLWSATFGNDPLGVFVSEGLRNYPKRPMHAQCFADPAQ